MAHIKEWKNLPDETTPLSAENLNGFLDWFYPIGTIYETTSTDLDTTTKMATHFGGTWEVYGAGRVLVAKSADTEFDTIGETGGAKTHTNGLTTAYAKIIDDGLGKLTLKATSGRNWSGFSRFAVGAAEYGTYEATYGVDLGGPTDAGSSLQPYIVVYRYRRTA